MAHSAVSGRGVSWGERGQNLFLFLNVDEQEKISVRVAWGRSRLGWDVVRVLSFPVPPPPSGRVTCAVCLARFGELGLHLLVGLWCTYRRASGTRSDRLGIWGSCVQSAHLVTFCLTVPASSQGNSL